MDIQARQPRGIVKVNGEIIPGWEAWEIDTNSFYQADTFKIVFAISELPAAYNAAWFGDQSKMLVEIFAGFPSNPEKFDTSELESLIVGQVDDFSMIMDSKIIELSGRDLTANLIDAKTTEKFQNQTASQVAIMLAERHNLTPVVTSTSGPTGLFYEIDHTRMNAERSEWDLLTALADESGMMVYVRGTSLYFAPKPSESDAPYLLTWEPATDQHGYSRFNGESLSFSRNLTLAKDIIVTVRSWNQKNKKGFSKTVRATQNKNTVLAGAAQPIGDAQTYQYTIPNATPEQVLQEAQSRLQQLSQHELKMSATLPGDNILDITNIIKVTGTGTRFDTIYYPSSIIREMTPNNGYKMHIEAKNHSPESILIS
ncbi:MAG: hypothetical protein KGI54_13660 [Pseudomonadota bacterium]|nr:hypothetical protein [Pseudomonadota bacterium]